jgi:hypothetical protein
MTIPSLPEPVKSPTQDVSSSVPFYDSENPPFVDAESYGEAQANQATTVEESQYATAAPVGSIVTATPTVAVLTTEAQTPGQSSDDMVRKRRRILQCIGVFVVLGFFLVNRQFFF